VAAKGLPSLTGGASSTQGQQISDLFAFEGNKVVPILKSLEVPVRAIVAPFLEKEIATIHR
jgi:hypothetical protein